MGAGRMLAERPPRPDTVLAFQPGEECDRGVVRTMEHHNLRDLGGAATAFAIHVNVVIAPRTVNFRRGTFMAFGDWFLIDYRGEGGHASQPESTGNPIEAAAWLVQDLRALVEELSTEQRLVATVTESLMGNAVNVIPTHGRLRGTLRTLSAGQRERLVEGLRQIVTTSAERAGVGGELELYEGYPAVVSDPEYVDAMLAVVRRQGLGDQLQEMERPSMVIEDFAYFLHRWSGTMVYLGANVPGRTSLSHSADVEHRPCPCTRPEPCWIRSPGSRRMKPTPSIRSSPDIPCRKRRIRWGPLQKSSRRVRRIRTTDPDRGEIQQKPAEFSVTEMWQVITEAAAGCTHADQITMFDSVGFAIEDFAALRYLCDTVTGSSTTSTSSRRPTSPKTCSVWSGHPYACPELSSPQVTSSA